MAKPPFWRAKSLDEMSREEWESLCDGCGRCCMLKLEDEDTGDIAYTDIHCRLYDPDTRRCGNYALRQQLVKGCVRLTPDTIQDAKYWMPNTCAYRLLAEGDDLPKWHPLITGRRESVAEAGIAMGADTIPEYEVSEDEYEDRIIEGMA
ncbi:MAG: YcgN family cysteine cluster protein [Pseudomonadota bacterium]